MDVSYGKELATLIPIAPIEESSDVLGEIAVEETFNPVDAATVAQKTSLLNYVKRGFDIVIERPNHWVFHHLIPKCTYGIGTEGHLGNRIPVRVLMAHYSHFFADSFVCRILHHVGCMSALASPP